ncbi:MAG TPA: alpha/beta hydrolase [Thermomicrobiales bacterium]|nr:alpha/beta hydrolase [Thermomicrobiales bacterium]
MVTRERADAPRETRVVVNGVALAVYEWAGATRGARTVLCAHAAGFHARCWDRVIAHLPGPRCVAVDLRDHGRSDKPPPPFSWRAAGLDVAALARALDLRDALGVGHSLGGYAVTRAAATEPGRFGALLLLDPVIQARGRYGQRASGEHFAARRRDRWSSPAEMLARFRERPPFNRWDPTVLSDYCEYGLLPAPDGEGYVLACPPALEASIYAGSAAEDIYDAVEALDIPVRVVRAGGGQRPGHWDARASFTAPDLAAHFKRGEDILLADRSHFIPMEAPETVAGFARELAGPGPGA